MDSPGWRKGACVVPGTLGWLRLQTSFEMCQLYVYPIHPPPSTTSCLSLGVGPGHNPVRGCRFGPFYLLCWVNSWDASGIWSSPPSPQQMGPCLASTLSGGAVAKSQCQRSLFNSVITWPNCLLGTALFL